jgi:hypothetical protein
MLRRRAAPSGRGSGGLIARADRNCRAAAELERGKQFESANGLLEEPGI